MWRPQPGLGRRRAVDVDVGVGQPRLLLLLLSLSSVTVTECLRIEDVTFPNYVMLGQTVTLVCDYSVSEGEYVDSIKWYKDKEEFYRHLPNTPHAEDKVVHFARKGIQLDLGKSGLAKNGHHQLVLQDVTMESTGRYMCQITESKPPFHTEQRERNLTVIIRPETGPEMVGVRDEYSVDETIDILCTSERSYPAAQLDFFINDEPVGEHLKTRYPIKRHPDGLLETSSLGLQYLVRPKNLLHLLNDDNKLLVKCTAKIGNAYWQSVVHQAIIKRQGIMLESRSTGASVRHRESSQAILNLLTILLQLLFTSRMINRTLLQAASLGTAVDQY